MIKRLFSLIRIDWKKGILGLLLAAGVLLMCFEEAPKKSLLLAVLCACSGFAGLNIQSSRWRTALGIPMGLLCVVMTCLSPFFTLNVIGFGQTYGAISFRMVKVLFFNGVCVLIVCALIGLISGRVRTSFTLGNGAMVLLGIINAFIYQFRGKELMFVDLRSIGTAINVASQYTPHVSAYMFFWWAVWGMLFLLLYAIPAVPEGSAKKVRLKALAAEAALIAVLVLGTADMYTYTWDTRGTETNGYFLNFYMGFRDSFVTEPEGYTPEALAQLEKEYADAGESAPERPNVIVIMNESFADLSVLGSAPRTNIPVTPFLDSLQENTIRGNALVSVLGGNTANSEFEFLTGHSTAFLPDGTVPYQYYIEENLPSLPWLMSSLGYDTFATHPYLSTGWSRTRVYPLLGFDSFTFQEDYPQQDLIRTYVSDREMYEYVLQKLEDNGDAPLFLFGITMQNHGSFDYDGDNFDKTVELEGYEQEYPMAEQYLSLINHSDTALKYLITRLEAFPEDTVLLFFGDHLPKVEDSFYEELHGDVFMGLDQQVQKYTVPFFVWANYDIPEQQVECTSLNYLSTYLLEAAGIPLPPYYRLLKEAEQQIPAISALGYYSLSQGTYLDLEEAEGTEKEWLNRCAWAQYNNMFDTENRSGVFFRSFLPGK